MTLAAMAEEYLLTYFIGAKGDPYFAELCC
jgi:hypothetical protein